MERQSLFWNRFILSQLYVCGSCWPLSSVICIQLFDSFMTMPPMPSYEGAKLQGGMTDDSPVFDGEIHLARSISIEITMLVRKQGLPTNHMCLSQWMLFGLCRGCKPQLVKWEQAGWCNIQNLSGIRVNSMACGRCGNSFNTLRPRQNGRHFADDTFNCIFVNENVRISIKFSLKFVPKGQINNVPALV